MVSKARKNGDKVFFFDESRFGTHSRVGHGWFNKGERTRVKIKLGFKNFYVYSAIAPKDGEAFSLILPKVNAVHMSVFLDEMSKNLGNQGALVIMDGAGWHKSARLKIPDNIRIALLPPYSPELNPVERFWQHVKDNVLKNRVFDGLDALESSVCCFLNSLNIKTVQSLCRVNYLDHY